MAEGIEQVIDTPSFVVEAGAVAANARRMQQLFAGKAKVLFSVKAMAVCDAIVQVARAIDGLSVSSEFEARLARECAGDKVLVQYVGPLLRSFDLGGICRLCNRVTLNSLAQLDSYRE